MDTHAAKDFIRSQVSIVDVASKYTNLVSAGAKMKGLSPFKSEKTPSFFVDPDKNLFYCFSTGQGGDIFSFVELVEGVDFLGALQYLAQEYGIDISKSSTTQEKKRKTLIGIYEESLHFYRTAMTDAIVQYLSSRGITEPMQKEWGIGYAPSGWTNLFDHLKNKGYIDRDLVDTGLVIKKERGCYDRFRDRIMFPLHEHASCIGFAGRLSPTNIKDEGKYINIPETMLYKKKRYCYGLHRAKKAMRDTSMAILTEGYTDVIAMHAIGYAMTVASSGTATTREHVMQIGKYTKNIVLLFDGDTAGMAAAKKTTGIALGLGMEVKIGLCPLGSDPADIALANAEDMKDIVRNAQKAIIFFLDTTEKKEIAECIQKDIFPLVSVIQDSIQKEVVLKEIATHMNLLEENVMSSYAFFLKKRKVPSSFKPPVSAHIVRANKREQHLLYAYEYLKKRDIDVSTYEECISFIDQRGVDKEVCDLFFEKTLGNMEEDERVKEVWRMLSDISSIVLLDIYKKKMDTILTTLSSDSISEEERERLEKEYRVIKEKRENIII